MKYVAGIFLGLFSLKAVLILGFIVYHYTFNKLKRRLYTPTTIGILWFGNYLVFNSFTKELSNFPEPMAHNSAVALVMTLMIIAILVSDIVFFRVWKYITKTTGHITKEMLLEWETPKPE